MVVRHRPLRVGLLEVLTQYHWHPLYARTSLTDEHVEPANSARVSLHQGRRDHVHPTWRSIGGRASLEADGCITSEWRLGARWQSPS